MLERRLSALLASRLPKYSRTRLSTSDSFPSAIQRRSSSTAMESKPPRQANFSQLPSQASGHSDDKFFRKPDQLAPFPLIVRRLHQRQDHSYRNMRISSETASAIVTCNKIANSSSQEYYDMIRTRGRGVTFNYETNVGAALPVIQFDGILTSGRRPHRQHQPSVSGSLSYIFNSYDGSSHSQG